VNNMCWEERFVRAVVCVCGCVRVCGMCVMCECCVDMRCDVWGCVMYV